jgi:hypothetical protein
MSFEFAGKPIKCRAAVAWKAAEPLSKLHINIIKLHMLYPLVIKFGIKIISDV